MGLPRLSLKRALLLSAFAAAGVLAQNNDDETTTPAAATSTNRPGTATAPANTQTARTSTTANSPPPRTSTSQTSEEPEQTSSQTSLSDLPGLSTSTSELPQPTGGPDLTGLPTLSKTVDTNIPEYPPPTIPPTRNAPFMNHSTLPDGTVFIAVGAILAAFGLGVLIWRGIIACLLHRSVERAALAQHAANDKSAASFPAPPSQFYKYLERESSASLAVGGAAGVAANRKSHRGPTPSATPSQTNLFFSPTAAGGAAAGMGGGSSRNSQFLPSGFYASASPLQSSHAQGNSISMSTLRPTSRGRPGALGPSPPESPSLDPRIGSSRNFSSSEVNLTRPPSAGNGNGGRAPSAYLDDLLGDQPGLFPPAGMSPQSQGPPHQGGFGGSPTSPQGRRY
ncbi:hypothetical protein QBC35DRAFT_132758 [Podospora australis]|uniref:CSI2 protein n=1 Tax=Podospora australis TaxID=1536484 RepID=A0AAN6WWT4_9PEZI|nr:hypothetical protein QBC35DRAFT_132758 [Podospora australis]